MYSTSFERSDSYLFGAKVQGCGMTFNRFYVGLMYPYFISYRGKWVFLFCRGCIPREAPAVVFSGRFSKLILFSVVVFDEVESLP